MHRTLTTSLGTMAAGPLATAGTALDAQPEPASAEWAQQFTAVPEPDHAALRAANMAERGRDPRPNILLIYTDQQTFSALSATGNPWLRTPNMDLLARHGVSFARSYCPSPICGPSRGAFAYGRHPHEMGVRYNGETPHAQLSSIGQILRDSGYDTTWTGKWHLPASYPKASEIQGFHYLPLPENLQGAFLGDVADMQFAQRAGAYLRWHAGLSAKPWFLGVSLHNPHDICYYFMNSGQHTDMPEPDPRNIDPHNLPPLPANHDAIADESQYLRKRRAQTRYGAEIGNYGTDLAAAHWRAYLKSYYSMTETVDRCLAPVLRGLEAGGWTDNTLVVFTSDHGEGMAAHKWYTKLSLYEETLRVPFIAIAPGQWKLGNGRTESHALVSGLDFAATCADYAGADTPAVAALHGRSLRPLIEGTAAPESWREHLVVPIDLSPERPDETGRAVMSADGWKYHVYSGGDQAEALYDLNSDPGETRNRIAGEPAIRAQLRAALAHHIATTNDPFPLAD
jgi:arylsulfatase A-like enzyme